MPSQNKQPTFYTKVICPKCGEMHQIKIVIVGVQLAISTKEFKRPAVIDGKFRRPTPLA